MRRCFWLLALLCVLVLPAHAQTFIIQPPTVFEDGRERTRVLFKPSDTVNIRWSKPLGNGVLRVGSSPGNYDLASVPLSGVEGSFSPGAMGLSTGVYYGIITTSSETTLDGIQADAGADYSPEFPLVVESATAPPITAPRGGIDNATPTFSWEAVPGVPAYVVLVSSTPFAITRDDNDQLVVEGANIVWQYLTTETSAVYGATNTSSPLPDFGTPPPLQPNNEYNYTVLNMYSEVDAAFLSDVFGTIVSFTYEADQVLPAPQVTAPDADAVIPGDETITFEWDPVDGAANYQFYLFERVRDGQTVIELPIWNTTTTNTLLDFSARSVLSRGEYVWYVIPNDAEGTGTESERRAFTYEVDMAEFRYYARSSVDNTDLIGVSVTARSLDGGPNVTTPFLSVDRATYSDSLVVGRYEFIATKPQHADTTIMVDLQGGTLNRFNIYLRPLPSRIAGTVVDEAGEPVSRATVELVNSANEAMTTATTNSAGTFSADVQEGTYTVTAAKAGYIGSEGTSVSVEPDAQATLDAPLVLTNDAVTVAGKAVNNNGDPVQLATVTATDGTTTQQTTTNGSGDYAFVLSSGTWTLTASKDGFVAASPEALALSVGDNVQNVNLTLQESANQVTGSVYEVITQADGRVDRAAFEDATVIATPNSGDVVTTTPDASGQFTLNLPQGTYRIEAQADGYAPYDVADVQVSLGVGQNVNGIDFELTPNTSSIAGRVTLPDGSEVEGAQVTSSEGATATTSSTGAFTLSVAPGIHTVQVALSGYVASATQAVAVASGDAIADINFTLVPNAGVITGKVTNQGNAVAEATVTASRGTESVATETGSDGRYALSVTGGTWEVAVSKDGFAEAEARTLTVGAGQTSSDNNFGLTVNTVVVEGTVTDGSAVVRSATVAVTNAATGKTESTLTRADGGFRLTLEPATTYELRFSRTGFLTVELALTTPAAGETAVQNVTLAPSPASVEGTIYDTSLRPLAGAQLTVEANGASVATATASVSGAFSVEVSAGSYTLVASAPGFSDATQDVTVTLGQALSGLEFTLADAFASLRGTVRDGEGNAVVDARVTATGASSGGSARTAADGTYFITGLVAGTYTLAVEAASFATTGTDVTLVAGQTLSEDVTLASLEGAIAGTITETDGTPVAGATVTATDASGATQTTVTDATGAYRLAPLALGTYTVTASRSGYSGGDAVTTTLTAEQPDATASLADLVRNSSAVVGVVRDVSSGDGLLNARVTVSGTSGSGTATTNTGGNYSLDGLAAGTYTVTATADGYGAVTETVTLAADETRTVDASLQRNDGIITGRVIDTEGQPLPFAVKVVATFESTRFEATADDTGFFTFNEVDPSHTYDVQTDIFREGYVNAKASASFSKTGSTVDLGSLVVQVNKAVISGVAGTSGATMQIIRQNSDEVVRAVTSQSDGSYAATLLPAGSYRVVPTKEGFQFTPSERTVTVGVAAQQEASFAAASNVGTLVVTVQQASGSPRSGATVSVASTDNSTVRSATTGSAGTATFANLPAGKTYAVQVSGEGYIANPERRDVTLSGGQTANASFSTVPSDATISGTVRHTEALSDASVTARRTSTGRVYRTTSDSEGRYALANLPGGDYSVVASKSGFVNDTTAVTLASSAQESGVDLTLVPVNVRLVGRVMYQGEGVPRLAVAATSSAARLTTTTTNSGFFVFPTAPIAASAESVTSYQIRITGEDIATQTLVVDVTGDQAGTQIRIPNVVLPSGQLTFAFTDGVAPLAGVAVSLARPNGDTRTATTGAAGTFTSAQTLSAGTYRATASKTGYLRPSATSLRFTLETNDERRTETIALPYKHTAPAGVAAGRDATVTVRFRRGFDPADAQGTTATLYYRRTAATSFTAVPMARQDTLFAGVLPAQFSLEPLTYYVEVNDAGQGIAYSSLQRTLEPSAEGIPTTVRVTPALSAQRLRVGEAYDVTLDLRDGVGKSLLTNDVPTEMVATAVSGALHLDQPSTERLTFTADAPGAYTLTLTARQQGIAVTRQVRFTVVEETVEELELAAPVARLSNDADGVQIGLTATDADGGALLLGTNLTWEVSPSSVADVSPTGFVEPTDERYIGPLSITATDTETGLQATSTVRVYAVVDGTQSYTLTDAQGLELELPQGAIPFQAEIGLAETVVAKTKKFVRSGANGTTSYTVGDRARRFTFRADRALPGDSLLADARISWTDDPSLELFNGPRVLARFDPSMVQWRLLETDANAAAGKTGSGLAAETFRAFGEYAVLVENEALGVAHLSVLPNPFSPNVAPLKIGYQLSTAAAPAEVSVRVYNLRGDLVRTLVDAVPQQPGRYGSRFSSLEITWDGMTDFGTLARNGRYLIQVQARDASGEVTELIPVVLIK